MLLFLNSIEFFLTDDMCAAYLLSGTSGFPRDELRYGIRILLHAISYRGLRLILIFLFILAFIENILHVIYYLLFDKNSTMCRKVELAFGSQLFDSDSVHHLPIDLSSNCPSLNAEYFMRGGGWTTTSCERHVMRFLGCRIAPKSEEGFVEIATSGLNQQEIVENNIAKSIAEDITKLPEGTKFKTCSDRTFNMEYCVENGVFVGTRTEKTNKTVFLNTIT
uniref:C-type lectin domain-containing protein n=1 Tax=Angiostrongylus cantonensis TaxID=6313 RepID=A0A0K0DC45_ANGCA